MFPRRILNFACRRTRQFITGVALIAYLGSVWGVPVPQAAAVDHSQAFPCQGHECGCSSAAQCWQSCCCFTPAERLAWAAAHHVEIPAAVRQALASQIAPAKAHRACCDQHEHASEHEEHRHDEHGQQCGQAAHEASSASTCDSCGSRPSGVRLGWVPGFQARKCQGLTMLWVVSGASLPLRIADPWEFQWIEVGQLVGFDEKLSGGRSAPPVPPPSA